tara:strand:- start:670 stop:915 length:246 start_codon:yes stop_codon:yes gene_type:complete
VGVYSFSFERIKGAGLYAGSGASDAITSTIIISVPGVERFRISVSFFSFFGVTSWGLRKSPCLQANASKPTARGKGPRIIL